MKTRPEVYLTGFSLAAQQWSTVCSFQNLEDTWQVEKLKTRGHTFNASLDTCIKHLVTHVWEANPQKAESIWQRNTFCLGLDLGRGKKSSISSFLIVFWQSWSTALQDYYDYRLQCALQRRTFEYLLNAWLMWGWWGRALCWAWAEVRATFVSQFFQV